MFDIWCLMETKELRIKLGLTQRQAAKIYGVATRTICRWDNLEREPELAYVQWLKKMCDDPYVSFEKKLGYNDERLRRKRARRQRSLTVG